MTVNAERLEVVREALSYISNIRGAEADLNAPEGIHPTGKRMMEREVEINGQLLERTLKDLYAEIKGTSN